MFSTTVYTRVLAEAGFSENKGALEALALRLSTGLALSVAIGVVCYLLLQALAELTFSSQKFTVLQMIYMTTLIAILVSLATIYVAAR